jgi:hypothetical protein
MYLPFTDDFFPEPYINAQKSDRPKIVQPSKLKIVLLQKHSLLFW